MAETAWRNGPDLPTGKVNPWELARTGGRWAGEVPAGRLERLQAVVSSLAGDVRVDLRFALDHAGGCQFAGTARVAAELSCERCLRTVPCELVAEIDALAVVGEAAAQSAPAEGRDVCVLTAKETPVEALVEDDFLLSLPTRVCAEPERCPHAPTLSFPAQAAATLTPFAALAALDSGNHIGQP